MARSASPPSELGSDSTCGICAPCLRHDRRIGTNEPGGVIIPPVRMPVLLAALLAGACGARAEPANKPAAPTVVWHQLGSWSGHGDAQTESFTSDTGTLRVRWETAHRSGEDTAGSSSPLFRVTAHSAISGRLLQQIVDHADTGSGVAYVQQDPHVFYVVVESERVDWKFTVEEAVAYP